jgi:hypothetical protein
LLLAEVAVNMATTHPMAQVAHPLALEDRAEEEATQRRSQEREQQDKATTEEQD